MKEIPVTIGFDDKRPAGSVYVNADVIPEMFVTHRLMPVIDVTDGEISIVGFGLVPSTMTMTTEKMLEELRARGANI